MEILEGLVETIIFKSDDSGYIVAKITANKEVVTMLKDYLTENGVYIGEIN